jgi:hypothetical protein
VRQLVSLPRDDPRLADVAEGIAHFRARVVDEIRPIVVIDYHHIKRCLFLHSEFRGCHGRDLRGSGRRTRPTPGHAGVGNVDG